MMSRRHLSYAWHLRHTGIHFSFISLFCTIAGFLITFYISIISGSISFDHFILHIGLFLIIIFGVIFVLSSFTALISDSVINFVRNESIKNLSKDKKIHQSAYNLELSTLRDKLNHELSEVKSKK